MRRLPYPTYHPFFNLLQAHAYVPFSARRSQLRTLCTCSTAWELKIVSTTGLIYRYSSVCSPPPRPHHFHFHRRFTYANSHQSPARTPTRSGSGALSRSRERRSASTTDVYGRRSSDSGGVGAPGEEKGPGGRHVGGPFGGDGFRLNLERAITTRMQEQLQVHR